nr:hypothetical protein [Actinoplanes italicus]
MRLGRVQDGDVLHARHGVHRPVVALRGGAGRGLLETGELQAADDGEQTRGPVGCGRGGVGQGDRHGRRHVRVRGRIAGDGPGAHRVPDERDPRRVHVRQRPQVGHRRVQVPLEGRGGLRGAGGLVRQRPGVGAVAGEVEQHDRVAARRQGVAERGHQPRRPGETVRHDDTRMRAARRREHHVQGHAGRGGV